MPPMGANPRHNPWLPTHPTADACTPPRVGRGGRKGQGGSSKGHNSLHCLFPHLVNLWRAEGGEEEGIFILQHTKEVMKVWQCQSLAACHGITGQPHPFCWGRVFVVSGEAGTSQTPLQGSREAGTTPARHPLPPATAGWHRRRGLVEGEVMGDVSAGRC